MDAGQNFACWSAITARLVANVLRALGEIWAGSLCLVVAATAAGRASLMGREAEGSRHRGDHL